MQEIDTSSGELARADLAIGGAGIVGLSLAYEAVRRGLSVVVVDADARASGSSVRNFGHGCLTAQTGTAAAFSEAARERWLGLRDTAGLWVRESGTVVAARSARELAVLEEFVTTRAGVELMLSADEVLAHAPVNPVGLVGGAFLPRDLRIDPRQAVGALTAHLAELGVEFYWRTTVLGFTGGSLHTSRGAVRAPYVALALNHDLDRLLPSTAEAGLTRCQLHMLRVRVPGGIRLEPALLSGTSLLRYSGFTACPSSAALRAEVQSRRPELLAIGVNLMMTQAPDGELIIGDTHAYDHTPSPFSAEDLDTLLLAEAAQLLGVDRLEVRERWLGTYASAPGDYLVVHPEPGVLAATVTSGIGMTTGLGLAPELLDQLLASTSTAPATASS